MKKRLLALLALGLALGTTLVFPDPAGSALAFNSSPKTAVAGTPVTIEVSGTGCIPQPPVIVASVTVTLATTPALTATVTPTPPLGDWSTTLTVPATVPAGTYALTAKCTLSPLGDFAVDSVLPPRVDYLPNSFTLTEPARVAATAVPTGAGFLEPAVPVLSVPRFTG